MSQAARKVRVRYPGHPDRILTTEQWVPSTGIGIEIDSEDGERLIGTVAATHNELHEVAPYDGQTGELVLFPVIVVKPIPLYPPEER